MTREGYKGELHIAQQTPDGNHVVAFDVLAPDGWYIYDTREMTPEQIRVWTGRAPGEKRGAATSTTARTKGPPRAR